ncbi:hypothetical protein AC578_8173 [Pseudocercospora eumusae]|uniref:Hydrophobin n=1 Tax=Pseudocercospora eumusae TaxID=321146 RepID=A0A139HEV3_9PEZI|nr:hypothetical protein AC578_8173 [Pseudocercospora eumusae]
MPSFTSIVSILAVATSTVMAQACPAHPSHEAPHKQYPNAATPETYYADPAVEDPAVEDPPVEYPSVEDPAVEYPSVEDPPFEYPSVEDPITLTTSATTSTTTSATTSTITSTVTSATTTSTLTSTLISTTTSTTTSSITPEPTVPAQGNCNANSAVSCCNTDGQTIGNILGASCFLNLPVLGTTCETGSAFCCETDQVGLINVNTACSPIGLL